jgi:hypothetical protein
MFCAAQDSTVRQFIYLVLAASFLAGAWLIVNSVYKLIAISDSNGRSGPGQGLSSALVPISAGAFLMTLPATIAIGLNTLYGNSTSWDISKADKVGDAQGILGTDSAISMIGNFAINAAGPLTTLVMAFSVVIGVLMVATSVMDGAKMSSNPSQQVTFGGLIVKFFVGIAMVNIFWITETIGASFGLPSNSSATFTEITKTAEDMSRRAVAANDVGVRFIATMDLVFLALIPFGIIAFVRGLLIIKDFAQQNRQASVGAGATHLIGGIALVNAKVVSCAVLKTLAGTASFCIQ